MRRIPFQIELADGTVLTEPHKNWEELFQAWARNDMSKVIRITQLDRARIIQNMKSVNDWLHRYCKSYHPSKTEAEDGIREALERHDFRVPSEFACPGNDGRGTVPVGGGAYLTVTWYQLESGNWEFVAYVS